MKLVLVIPNIRGMLGLPSCPQVGVAYLAGMARYHGFDVEVVDMRLGYKDEYVLDKIGPGDVVGVYCTSFGHKMVYDLIRQMKLLDCKVIIGGPHVSVMKQRVMEECEADLAVFGEGEYTLLEILEQKPSKDILGLIWRDGSKVVVNACRGPIMDPDELPLPAYDLFERDKYMDNKLSIITSRGCPFLCTYCSVFYVSGRNFRPRDPIKVVDELEYWVKMGYRYFDIGDDNFSLNMDRAKVICKLIIERGLDIKFEMRNGLRVDCVDEELLVLLKRAGCQFIAYGVESLDEETLILMKKRISKDKVVRAYELTKAAGIPMSMFFIIGLPGDNWEKFLKNLEFARSIDLDEVRFYTAVPYPGSELYEWIKGNARLKKADYLNDLDMFEGWPVYETDDFSFKERRKAFLLAETEVVRLFVKSQFGKVPAFFAYWTWRALPFRKAFYSVGKAMITMKRRLTK